jgi:hypothetical protein
VVVRPLAFLVLRRILGMVGAGRTPDAKDWRSRCCATSWRLCAGRWPDLADVADVPAGPAGEDVPVAPRTPDGHLPSTTLARSRQCRAAVVGGHEVVLAMILCQRVA